MENLLSCREMAQVWGVSERRVGQYCAEGRVAGARKVGKSWVIPADAEKPADPRRSKSKEACMAQTAAGASSDANAGIRAGKETAAAARRFSSEGLDDVIPVPRHQNFDAANLMPLMNTAFEPGTCMKAVESMAPGAQRDIALAEYYYFSAQPEAAGKQVEGYLASTDMATRLSACLIYAYACLPMGQIEQAERALSELNASLGAAPSETPQLKAASAFVASAAAVLLHLPLPKETPKLETFAGSLPPGLRAFALYVQAHYLYLEGEYARSAGIAEATLAMGAASYPIPAIYLHLVAVMDYMSLKRPGEAQAQLLAAWDIARPDDLIEGFGEHHGLLGAMLEAAIKPQWPDDFRRIIDITYRFSSGWRRVHNPATGDDVADDLTTTEFAIAMLAARDWTTAQIAAHMGISASTVKTHISTAMRKLNVASRKDLKKYMLR